MTSRRSCLDSQASESIHAAACQHKIKTMNPLPLISAMLLVTLSTFGAIQRPNILFIFADDMRADTVAALGNPNIQTPNLDRLVRSGLAFNRAYMQGGLNGATCVPSRAMLLSGRSLFRVDEKLLRDETWPAAFGHAGYATFVSGKWHNGRDSIAKSFQAARGMFVGGMGNPMQMKLSDLSGNQLGPPESKGQHACATFADETIRFLTETKAGAPFFCYVPFDAPHDPHIVPDEFPIRYDATKIPLPPNFLPQYPWDNGEMLIRDEKLLPWPRTPEKVRAYLADYYRYVSYLDAQIGRVLDALAASPHATNTVVVFSADSGVACGSHGLIGKQNLYDLGSVRVPLLISGPGLPIGQRTDAMCYLFDVLPTLGKLCGVPAPKTSEGVEFTAALKDPAKPARSELMFAYKNVQRAVRNDRWKLIRYPLINKTQLFDLQTDPYEIKNLADQPGQAAKVAELLALLARQQKEFGDTAPLSVANPNPASWTPPAPTKTAAFQQQSLSGEP
jgi:arylsulfatase A-like enzyme